MSENIRMFVNVIVNKGKSITEIRFFFSLYAIHNGYSEEDVLKLADTYTREFGISII